VPEDYRPKKDIATNQLPSGTITFLFSDIEGSTRLLEELGDRYVALLQEHNRIFREVIREYEGAEVSTEGDSFFVVFRSPLSAVDAAAHIQRRLADAPFAAAVRVRMGLHTGQGISPAATRIWPGSCSRSAAESPTT
jgi:class 3 adenylate cyclase